MIGFWYDGPEPKRDRWQAGYPIQVEVRDQHNRASETTARVVIEGVESDECPKSLMLLNPRSDELVQIFIQSENAGGGFSTPDKWPGWFFDAVTLLRAQKLRDENERARAIRSL